MQFLPTILLVLSVAGAFAQDDTAPAQCDPPSHTAKSFSAVDFKVYSSETDYTRQLILNEDSDNGDWTLTDFQERRLYTNTGGVCTYHSLPAGLTLDTDTLQGGSTLEYEFTNPRGDAFRAWTYTDGALKMQGFFNNQCISTMTTVSVNDVVIAINFVYKVNIDSPDFASLDEKYAIATDGSTCTEVAMPTVGPTPDDAGDVVDDAGR